MAVYEVETANGKWMVEAESPKTAASSISDMEMLDRKIRYYTGPHLYKSLVNMGNGITGMLKLLSPGGDIEDMLKASRETATAVGERDFGKMIVGTATMAAATVGVMLPGTPGKAVKHAGEAVLDARKAVDDLPMDEASRMARAKEMGFTTDAYKGAGPHDWRTGKEIEEFRSPGVPDEVYPDYVGKKGGFAGFFTDDTRTANRFAGAVGGLGEKGGAVFPVKLKFKNPLVVDAGGKYANEFQFSGPADRGGTSEIYKKIKRALEGATKHDGVILKNTADEGTIYVPMKSNQVRSRFAKFDPAKKGSSNLLAGIGAGAAIGAPLAMYANRDDGEM